MRRYCDLCGKQKLEGSRHEVNVRRIGRRPADCPECEREWEDGCLLDEKRFYYYCEDCQHFYDKKHGVVDMD